MGFSTKADYSRDITTGKHVFLITKVVLGYSQKASADMLILQFTVCNPEDKAHGKDMRKYTVLVPAPWGYQELQKLCEALDVVGVDDDPSGLDPHKLDSCVEHLLGRAVIIDVVTEDAKGRDGKTYKRSEPVSYHRVPKPMLKELKDDGHLELPEDWNLDFDGNALPLNNGSSDEFSGGFSDEDIPF
jgi:hypothetical protein